MTVTHKPITHPSLPGATFAPRLDTDGVSIAYWGAHFHSTPAAVCETTITVPGEEPRHFIEPVDPAAGLTLEELHELVATINTYYAAVCSSRARTLKEVA